jgi:glycosyltransferase involved in cell wall biosynthesis
MRYLLVTHIPFFRQTDGSLMLDKLWADDLKGLVSAVGPVTVAAPELPAASSMSTWGPGVQKLTPEDGITFVGLPAHKGRFDLAFPLRVRSALRPAVSKADIVHSSNLFPPYTSLWQGHDLAVRLGKKTLFVVAEDFYDMLNWEWVRPTSNWLQKLRRRRMLSRLHRQVCKRIANASLTFLHTPAAVIRYREFAANAVAIRQPLHELEDIISPETFAAKCNVIRNGSPLKLTAACRMEPLKGIDFLLRALFILKQRNIPINATLYGAGKQLQHLNALARALDIDDLIQFPGSVSPGPALRDALSAGHIFMMPHLTTDFGRAFFDAMASGSPVIAFRSPASQDTVRDRVDGLLTPNADAEGLADGIAQFHYDREFLVRASEAARTRALRNTKSFWNQLRGQMVNELFQQSPVAKTVSSENMESVTLSAEPSLSTQDPDARRPLTSDQKVGLT